MYNNKRLALSIFWIVLGVTLIGLSVAGILDSTIYSGMGGGFAAVGAMQLFKNIKYRRNEEYKEKVDIEVNDERNRYIRMKSWSWAGYAMVIADAIAALVACVKDQFMLQQVFLLSICFMCIVYLISYVVASRRY